LAKKVTIEEPQFSFKPEIDKRSERLVQKKRPQGDFNSLYDVYADQQRQKEEKIKMKQERKIEAEMQECSFRPKLFTSPKGMNSTNNSNYFTDPLFY
jgi:transketolase